MIPQYSKKQILASYDEPIDTNVLWLHLQRTKEFEKPILKYYSPHGWIPLNDNLWDFTVNGVLTPKDNYKFSLTDAIEIKIQNGDDTLFLNKKGEFVRPSYFYYGPTAPQESKKYDIWASSITLNQYQFIEGVWIAFVPIKGLYGIIDGNSKDAIYLDGSDNKNILIDGNKDNFVIIQDIIY